jgi:hypothetical protein
MIVYLENAVLSDVLPHLYDSGQGYFDESHISALIWTLHEQM